VRCGEEEFFQKLDAGDRADDPGPAHVDENVSVVLRQSDILMLVRVSNVHENELRVGEGLDERHEVGRIPADPVKLHSSVARIITGVKFYRERQRGRLCHTVEDEEILYQL
jgi:hypothetical protein